MSAFRRKPLRVIYLVGFLFSSHLAITSFVNSSFLSEGCGCGIPEKVVGLLYTAGSLLAIWGLAKIPGVLNRIGNRKTLLGLLLLSAATLIGLTFLKIPHFVAPLFIVYLAINSLIVFSLDVFIEHYSSDKRSGDIRGMFLSILGLAWIVAPFAAGLLIERNGGFYAIYLVALFFILFVMAVLGTHFRRFQDPQYSKTSFLQTIRRFWKKKDLRKIFMANFVLQFFFAWMVIYTPIYLSQHINLPWNQIGLIFMIMLTPFVLFEIPLGDLADKKYGEKEILIIGYIVMAVTVGIMAFLTTSTWWIWALVLFGTRVGASAVQVMTESYFFKKVEDRDVNFIGVFRDTAPLAYAIAPFVATLILTVLLVPYNYLFLILALFVLVFGLANSIPLHDTK